MRWNMDRSSNSDHYRQIYTRRSNRETPYFKIPDLDPKKPCFKAWYMKLGDQEVDTEYVWLMKFMIEQNAQTEVIGCEDQNEYENENENENENKDEDPQYRMFLDNLTEHGKAYKLKISQDDEEPCYVYYEELDDSEWCDELQTSTDNSGDELTIFEDLQINQTDKKKLNEKNGAISTKKEFSRIKTINDNKTITPLNPGMIIDPCYQMYMNSRPELVAVKSEEYSLENEKNGSDSDSDIMILDNVQNCSEVKNKQLVVAEKESCLREKLLNILKQPYNEKEHEELSEYIEQKKPICRHLDLRGRPVSSALGGMEKSVLDDGPGSFKTLLNSAQNDPPKALNLLRMFCFWLEHVPNEDVIVPWTDKNVLKVRPSEKKAMMLLLDK